MLAPSVCSREDILDHMPPFLDNAITELELRAWTATGGEHVAVQHGVQRFELGFDVDALVRDTASSASASSTCSTRATIR